MLRKKDKWRKKGEWMGLIKEKEGIEIMECKNCGEKKRTHKKNERRRREVK